MGERQQKDASGVVGEVFRVKKAQVRTGLKR